MPADAQARTRLARRAVIAAAADLFTEKGYVSTTVEAVSERSEVPASTVYRLFGSKAGILKAWLDTAIGGDDAPVAFADRPPVAALAHEADALRLVAGFADVVATINRRSNAVYVILADAALTDPEAAAAFARIQKQRAAGQRKLTRSLERLGALRDGVNERHAADVVHALMSPEMYTLLVVDRRWSVRRYRDWLAEAIRLHLLPPSV